MGCMSCPDKYKQMGDFWEYYIGMGLNFYLKFLGRRKAPYLTIFVGGNHEASNYLRELMYGGWVSDNIYYLG